MRERFLLNPRDDAISTVSFGEHACDEGGRKKFAVLTTQRGVAVAEELYHKVYQSPRLPRVVLIANSQCGQQDQQEQDARTSCDHPSASDRSSRETWCNNVDYRIPGIPHSAVEQQDTNRRDTVKKLIQQFESHPNKESFLQDLNKTEEINEFIEKSQKLIADMNNTEIFELCETSSKKHGPSERQRMFCKT